MTEYLNTPETPAMSDEMKALAQQLADLRSLVAEFQTQQEKVNSDIKVHESAISALKHQHQDIATKIFDARKILRSTEVSLDNAVKIEEQRTENERARQAFQDMSDELDAIAADAVWVGKAFEHQVIGAKRLSIGARVLLADKMGLGKTLTLFMACDYNRAKRILYVTTADLVPNVVEESKIWAPKRGAFGMAGLPKVQRDIILNALRNADEFFVVINYEAWRKDKDLLQALCDMQFDTVIIDEAHKMKNVKSSNFQGVRKIVFAKNQCPVCGGNVMVSADAYGYERTQCEKLCDVTEVMQKAKHDHGTAEYIWNSAKFVYPATGTFILNRPREIFASLSLVAPTRFNNMNRFLDRYCVQDYNTGKWKFAAGGVQSLMKAIEGNIVARDLKSAGIVLPPQKVTIHNLTLDPALYPAQAKVLSDLRDFAAIDLKDEKVGIFHMLALITRQRQAITWPAGMKFASMDGNNVWQCDVSESIKIDYVMKYDNIENEWEGLLADATANGERNEHGEWTGDRVVLFSQFKTPLIEIERRLIAAGISVVRLDGDTSEFTAQQIRKDFDRKTFIENPGYEPKWQVILANYKSGGVGLNFTDCTQTIILDEEWNPGSRDQAYARTYRMGQTEETTVHVLRVAGSIDEWMAMLMEQKQNIVDGFEADVEMMQALRDILEKGNEAA